MPPPGGPAADCDGGALQPAVLAQAVAAPGPRHVAVEVGVVEAVPVPPVEPAHIVVMSTITECCNCTTAPVLGHVVGLVVVLLLLVVLPPVVDEAADETEKDDDDDSQGLDPEEVEISIPNETFVPNDSIMLISAHGTHYTLDTY